MGTENERVNQWQRNRRRENTAWMISFLGGKCENCGATEDLQMDHSEPELKGKNPGSMVAYSRERIAHYLIAEKVQLLCRPCHRIKTWLESP